jgi:hypothetical protein
MPYSGGDGRRKCVGIIGGKAAPVMPARYRPCFHPGNAGSILVQRGIPGKAALIFRKKYSSSR